MRGFWRTAARRTRSSARAPHPTSLRSNRERRKTEGRIIHQSTAQIPFAERADLLGSSSDVSDEVVSRPVPVTGSSVTVEPFWRRALYFTLAVVVAVGFFLATQRYWVPAHGGVDQNGYLVGGRNILLHGTMLQKPDDAFGFVGRMWVTGKQPGTYYPKYPVGLPAIYAAVLGLGGVKAVYLVNPVAMTLALVATYLIVARFAGPFYGLLGTLVVATSPVTTGLTNNPNSHATAVCTVAWGMYLLLTWWERPKHGRPSWARAIGAGLLLGTAVTIRYTEGLLLLPMGLVVLFVLWDEGRRELSRWWGAEGPRFVWKDSPTLQSVAIGVGWAIPVGILLIVNFNCFGTFTGYDPTNESTGFGWENLQNNWDTMLRQLYNTGLMFVFPVAVVGMAVLFRENVRRAMFVAAWVLPCVFIYTAYYWAPDGMAIGYSRFFLTVFPALVAAGAVALKRLDGVGLPALRLTGVATATAAVGLVAGTLLGWLTKDGWGPITGGWVGAASGAVLGLILPVRPAALIVTIGCAAGFVTAATNFENDQRNTLATYTGGQRILKNIPDGSVLFSKDALMHHAQFLGDWKCYSIDLFSEGTVRNLANQSDDLEKAQPFQAERAKALYDLLKNDRNVQLAKRQNELMDAALAAGRKVYVVAPKREYDGLKGRFLPPKTYDAKLVDAWDDPPNVSPPRAARWLGFNRPNLRPPTGSTAWGIVEVTKRATPTTAPTTATVTTRATR
jgi:4-amino-4-deoxy-L-arabinose transferase-like glycosyltransferase